MAAKKKPAKKAPKKRMGRPPRMGKAASSFVSVRLTVEERAALVRSAERAGEPLAVYIRKAALSRHEREA